MVQEENVQPERSGRVIDDLRALAVDVDEIDWDARIPLEEELLRQLADSPEGKKLSGIRWYPILMNLAADYFCATIATLRPGDLHELVFELVPRKVSVDASEASSILQEIRTVYAFLEREFRLPQAADCLRVVGDGAVEELEAALSNTGSFGMAKSLFMQGRQAGFDMDTKEGIASWMVAATAQSLGDPLGSRARNAPGSASDPTAAKRQQRKAARKARRDNQKRNRKRRR